MNTKVASALCLLATSIAMFVAGCSKPSSQPDAAPLQIHGRWSGCENGSSDRITISFTGDQFTYFDAKFNELGSGTFVANESFQPMHIDMTFEHMMSPEYEGKVGLAIYEIQSNRLTIAGCEPGSGQRPTNLVVSPGVRVFTLTRE